MPKYLKTLLTLFFAIILLLGFTETANLVLERSYRGMLTGNWYQQFMPDIGNRQIMDITFIDSLTGWSVTNATNQTIDTTYVLKTTNGGDNWVIQYAKIQTGGGFPGYSKVKFLNQNTGFVCGVKGIDKSTDGGVSWTTLNSSESYQDMGLLNVDTIWIVSVNPLTGGLFRTTNGGVKWTQQLSLGSSNPNKIYMYNARIGFIGNNSAVHNTYKTTNSGQSWFSVINESFTDMHFTDSLEGWKCWGELDSIKKTTNGGINWSKLLLPPTGGFFSLSVINKFEFVNRDTIWGVGARAFTSLGFRGLIYKSTNGGQTWGYQLPDSNNINITRYYYLTFINKLNGWAYSTSPTGTHTTRGGDTTFYTGLRQISSEVPKEFDLKQNYPNPFNPRTVIHYSIKKSSYVRMTAYDITGREVQKLVDQKQAAGEYETDFMGKYSASGIYFYRMEVTDDKTLQLFAETKKMILLK